MVCVGASELRLAPEELTAVAKLRSHPLGTEAAAELHDRTRGWAAGVVLMLEHRKLSGRIAELPGDATPQLIFDYLGGEIFDRFEAETRQFLLRIACLPRMTAELAQALSGEEKAARLLLNLALNHYFVDEIQSDEGRVFQLHPLLRDFLRRRAAQDLPEALGSGQLQRAALLLRAAGQTEDSISLLIECRDWAAVARIAAEDSQRMLEQGRGESLAMWIESLPEALRAADPRLLHALGACRSEATPRAARRYFEQAFDGFERAGDLAAAVQSACGVIDATLAEFDDLATLDRWTGVLAGILRDAPRMPSYRSTQAAATLRRALLVRNPGSKELDGWLAALFRGDFTASAMSIDALQAAGSAHDALSIATASALQQLVTGASEAALRIAQEALAANESEGGGRSGEAWLRVVGIAAALDAEQRDQARSELQRLEAAGGRGRRGDRAVQRYLRAWLAALDGDASGALREARGAAETALEA